MAHKKPCRRGHTLCNLYGGVRGFVHKTDDFLRHHGQDIGRGLQTAAPVAGALAGPQTALVAGALGKGLETYAQVRNEMGE